MNDKRIEERARFDFIRYANCWEDADILIEAFGKKPGKTYLGIASAGDNCFSMLTLDPQKVIAVDLNPSQLACLELRKQAFLKLTYEECLAFLGITMCDDRPAMYRELYKELPEYARDYWDHHSDQINHGVIHGGKFERYFQTFRKYVLPFILSRKNQRSLIAKKSEEEREIFYQKHLDTWRYRFLFFLFFNKKIMGLLGRDPGFFKYVEGDISAEIRERAHYAFTKLSTHDNPYLEYIITGNFNRSLPHYLRPEHYEVIRKNLNKLVIFHGSVADALKANSDTNFDGFNLSDIFEYMGEDQFKAEYELIKSRTNPGGRLCYWNMRVPRNGARTGLDGIQYLGELSEALFKKDKAFFYRAFVVEEINNEKLNNEENL